MSANEHSLDTAQWQQLDRQHHLHPFTDHKSLHSHGTRVITRAEGVYLWDSEGNRILDGMAGLWCVNIGYGRRELVDVAAKQMQELPYYNSFFKTTTPPAIELAKLLAEVTPPQFNHVFYTGSGSECNDTVLRMVRRYWDIKGYANKHVIISRKNAYHGSTVAGASLGGMSGMHAQGGLPIPDIVHIDQPYWYGEAQPGETPEAFGLRIARQLEAKILELGVDRVAAFIGEPIQGAGGVIIPPSTYWPEIQRICDHYGILLIADEVICGFGRTGKWFGHELFGFKPDLLCTAKGITSGYLPLGAVMIADRVAEVLVADGGEFNHGFTYSGHPVCCAVAAENIRILRDEGIIAQVESDTGPYFQAKLAELAEHPLVGETRGVGLVGAIELVKDKKNKVFFEDKGTVGTICRDFCFANGLIMRAVGDTLIVSPPLVISHAQIDEWQVLARKCLDLTARKLGMM